MGSLNFKNLLKLRAWKFFIYRAPSFLLIIFYILFAKNIFNKATVLNFFVLMTSLFFLTYGALVNDYFDIPYDIAVGKKRIMQKLSRKQAISLILIILFLGLAVSLIISIFYQKVYYFIVFVIAIILATFYSAPPIRLKTRGIYGFLTDILIEFVLPFLLIVVFFSYLHADVLIFLLFYFSFFFIITLEHQLKDYKFDKKIKISTFVVLVGRKKALKIFNYLCPLTLISTIPLIFLFYSKIQFFFIFLILIFMGYFSYNFLVNEKIIKKRVYASYFAYFADICIFVILPIFLAVLLFIKYSIYLFILLFTLALYLYILRYFIKSLKTSFNLNIKNKKFK